MKILVLNHNLRERGTFFRAREIARAFHERGHDVAFVCTGEGYYRPRLTEQTPRWAQWETANWTPLREPGEGYSPLGLLQRLFGLRQRWDLVYTFSHLPVDQGTARFLRKRCGFWMTDWCDLWNSQAGGLHDLRFWQKPLPSKVRGLRGAMIRASFRMEDLLEQRAARDADAVSVIASPMKRYARRLGIPGSRILHLVSGADTSRIRVLDRKECREKLGLPEKRLVLGYVANVTPDNDQLQGALEILWRAYPEVLMISCGPRWYEDGGIAHRAVKSGHLIDYDRRPFSEIPQYLGASDFLVMPLRDIPFNRCRWPNKFGDYMASGHPIATCDVGDMGRVAERFQLGTAGEASAEGLGRALVQLADSPEIREEAGRNARRAAERFYSWPRQIERLCRFLRKFDVDV